MISKEAHKLSPKVRITPKDFFCLLVLKFLIPNIIEPLAHTKMDVLIAFFSNDDKWLQLLETAGRYMKEASCFHFKMPSQQRKMRWPQNLKWILSTDHHFVFHYTES